MHGLLLVLCSGFVLNSYVISDAIEVRWVQGQGQGQRLHRLTSVWNACCHPGAGQKHQNVYGCLDVMCVLSQANDDSVIVCMCLWNLLTCVYELLQAFDNPHFLPALLMVLANPDEVVRQEVNKASFFKRPAKMFDSNLNMWHQWRLSSTEMCHARHAGWAALQGTIGQLSWCFVSMQSSLFLGKAFLLIEWYVFVVVLFDTSVQCL